MNCPKCKSRMRVTNTYPAGDAGRTQRAECPCGMVATLATLVVAYEPERGAGAARLARRMAKDGPAAVAEAMDLD